MKHRSAYLRTVRLQS